MGNFDAAAVIKAAATSNLGVVSLLALVLAFLAWRFFQRSEDRIKLIAFAMMFLGAAGFVTAVMVAGGDSKNDEASASEPAASPTSTPTAAPAPTETAPAPGVVNIAGAWHDADGYSYAIVQDGSTFNYTFALRGAQVGRGAGTIAGNRLTYVFKNDDGSSEGKCEAEVASDSRTIKGSCNDGSTTWAFIIER